MSTVYTLSALLHLTDIQLRGLLNRARYDLDCSIKGSIERRDALLNLEIIHRALAHAARAAPAAGVLNPDGLPALPKGSAGFARGCREESLTRACETCWHEQGSTKSADKKGADDAAAPDPVIVELVKLLARVAAERDYMRTLPQGFRRKGNRARQGE